MPALGTFVLLTAFVTCSYAIAVSVAGARRRAPRLVESGIGALYFLAALMVVASAILIHAFVTGNYAIRYVQRYSDAALPLGYKIASYWGGLDGSIMFWVTLLAIFGSIAVYVNRDRHRELIPYVVSVLAATEMFFIFLMVIHNNPFSTFLTTTPTQGAGLTPLLQNFYMAIHPPSMYVGFVAMTVPFAFGLAALITGHLDDAWLRAVRRWTMLGWLFLSFGLTLGMLWAYEELGWGGYWMWDPVENAGLLPWFTATAFLHSVRVQEQRGMLRVWNVTLVIVTFFLTIFGTFMTRSGVVQSVHAFGEDRELALLFAIFMVAVLVFSFSWVIYRLPMLRARNELDSWVSREAAFLANNWILLFSAFFVLFATMFPTLSEAVTGERLTVAGPFYNRWMLPIGLMLLTLTGIGPLLAWRKSSAASLVYQLKWPLTAFVVTAVGLYALGVRVWSSGLCFALCALVLVTITQEFVRGAAVRRAATGTDILTALIGLVGRSKRRYGGYIVHVGVVLIFLGFAGDGFKREEQALMKPGQTLTVGDFTVRHDTLRVTHDAQKQMVTGHVTVTRGGNVLQQMQPARWYFKGREQEVTTEVAIRRGLLEDLYIVLQGYDAAKQSVTYTVTVNPLVNWIWFGFAVMAIGTIIALLPETAYAFAAAHVPARAAGATTALLILVLLPATVVAQSSVSPKSQERLSVEGDIKCICGGCRASMKDCHMGATCHGLQVLNTRLDAYFAKNMNREEILAALVRDHGGQDILLAPIDEGFNRLAWLLPYVVGASGAVAVALAAMRWSRREHGKPLPAGPAMDDPALRARLDDELRDLE